MLSGINPSWITIWHTKSALHGLTEITKNCSAGDRLGKEKDRCERKKEISEAKHETRLLVSMTGSGGR